MRYYARLGGFARVLAVIAIGGAVLAFGGVNPAFAGGPPAPIPVAPGVGYGSPPPAPVPGGSFRIVVSKQICPAGGIVGPAQVNNLEVSLTVPRGAFPECLQVTLAELNVAALGNAGFACFRAVGGVGVVVDRNGRPFPGPFSQPVSVHFTGAPISHSSLVAKWNGSRFVALPASITAGSATVKVSTSPVDLAVLARVCKGAIPGAAKAGTGKPLLGEALLAGLLVFSGAGLITWARRRPRPRAQHL